MVVTRGTPYRNILDTLLGIPGLLYCNWHCKSILMPPDMKNAQYSVRV